MKLQACLGRAIEQLSEDQPADAGSMTGTGTDEYSLLITNICHHLEEEDYGGVSDIELEQTIHRVILQMFDLKQNGEEFEYTDEFHDRLDREVETDATTSFRVIFPLNIPQDQVEKYDLTFKAYGIPVRLLDFDEGSQLFNDIEGDPTRHNRKTLTELLDEYPDSSFPSEFDHSFWEITLSGSSLQRVLKSVTRTVRTIIGKINYIEYGGTRERIEIDSLLDGTRITRNCVMTPLFYCLLSDGEFVSWYSDNTIVQQNGVFLGDEFTDVHSLWALPSRESRPADEKVASALREFGMGVAAQSNQYAFIHYWQALEEATLVEEYAGSDEPLDRLSPFITLRPRDVYADIVPRISDKRNRLIHAGKDTEILVKDVELLHHLVSTAIEALMDLRKRNLEEIRGIMKYGDKSEENLHSIIKSHKDKIDNKEEEIGSAMTVVSEAQAAKRWLQERS